MNKKIKLLSKLLIFPFLFSNFNSLAMDHFLNKKTARKNDESDDVNDVFNKAAKKAVKILFTNHPEKIENMGISCKKSKVIKGLVSLLRSLFPTATQESSLSVIANKLLSSFYSFYTSELFDELFKAKCDHKKGRVVTIGCGEPWIVDIFLNYWISLGGGVSSYEKKLFIPGNSFPSTSPMSNEAKEIINSVNKSDWPDFYFCFDVACLFADVMSLLSELDGMKFYFNSIMYFNINSRNNFENNRLNFFLMYSQRKLDYFEDYVKLLYALKLRAVNVFNDKTSEDMFFHNCAKYLLGKNWNEGIPSHIQSHVQCMRILINFPI